MQGLALSYQILATLWMGRTGWDFAGMMRNVALVGEGSEQGLDQDQGEGESEGGG